MQVLLGIRVTLFICWKVVLDKVEELPEFLVRDFVPKTDIICSAAPL